MTAAPNGMPPRIRAKKYKNSVCPSKASDRCRHISNPRDRTTRPDLSITTPFFRPESSCVPNFSGRSQRNPEKHPLIHKYTDGAHDPACIPARPIAPGTLALKLRQPKIFRAESSRAEKFSVRNFKNRKIFGLKVENSKKIRRESWKKGC
jgi:hypothetical protein